MCKVFQVPHFVYEAMHKPSWKYVTHVKKVQMLWTGDAKNIN